jgi:hypothetical protein
MESSMKSPPANVLNWQAVLVTAVKRRALDLLGSSAVRHEVATDASRLPDSVVDGLADDVAELVDRQRGGAVLWDKLALLDVRHRAVVREYIEWGRPRQQVAAELGVTPGRARWPRKPCASCVRLWRARG